MFGWFCKFFVWQVNILQNMVVVVTEVDTAHQIFCAGDEEKRRGAEDEAKSDFDRATRYDRQLGEYFATFCHLNVP